MTETEIAEIRRFMPVAISGSERAEVWIEMAEKRVSRCYFGSSWTLAMSYMAAHIGTLEERSENDGAVGAVTSKREGDISVSYGSASTDGGDDLGLTSYGIQYKNLLKQHYAHPGLTGRFGCGGRF